jgi:hypothetical protein
MNFVKNMLNIIQGNSKDRKADFYYSYYLFGLSIDKPIWNWEIWEKCIPFLQSIIDICPETPSIKTSQSIPVTYGKNDQFVSHDKGSLRFGKMLWNKKDNEKWTTKYANENNWTFFDTEIAYPTRSHCHKNHSNPDLFITIHNENLTNTNDPKINQSITIHIRTSLIVPNKLNELEKNITQIGELLNWKIAGKIKRPTSFKSNLGIGYTDSFWDGSYGVLDINKLDFSKNYKRYGIEKIK